jgi:hypothetical protein
MLQLGGIRVPNGSSGITTQRSHFLLAWAVPVVLVSQPYEGTVLILNGRVAHDALEGCSALLCHCIYALLELTFWTKHSFCCAIPVDTLKFVPVKGFHIPTLKVGVDFLYLVLGLNVRVVDNWLNYVHARNHALTGKNQINCVLGSDLDNQYRLARFGIIQGRLT